MHLRLISIHSLNEEWDTPRQQRQFNYMMISIHSLNEEWDKNNLTVGRGTKSFQSTHSMKSETFLGIFYIVFVKFQSTHSMKSETCSKTSQKKWLRISIHSLNEEWDLWQIKIKINYFNFNPLTQWRVRRGHSTFTCISRRISIHSLNEEWDVFV